MSEEKKAEPTLEEKIKEKLRAFYSKNIFLTDVTDSNWGLVGDNVKSIALIKKMAARFDVVFHNMDLNLDLELLNLKASIGDKAFEREILEPLGLVETSDGFESNVVEEEPKPENPEAITPPAAEVELPETDPGAPEESGIKETPEEETEAFSQTETGTTEEDDDDRQGGSE